MKPLSMKNGKPDIYDIAKRAGVSIATVSRVLSGSAKVRESTRNRVLSVMESADYHPNAFARGLGLGSMKTIGILCTDVSDLYYAKAVSILERLLRKGGWNALLCCTGNDLGDKKKNIRILLDRQVDAIILVGSAFRESSDNSHIECAAERVPVIVINGLIECPNTYCVICNERDAVYRCAFRLYGLGYRHILYLYDVPTYSGMEKLEGFRRAAHDCGAENAESLTVRTEKGNARVEECISGLMERRTEIDAVMASEDLIASEALRALKSYGKNVPVIGFNNSVLAECVSLTSIDNMLESMCTAAVGIMNDVLAGQKATRKITVEARLVVRESCSFRREPNQK